MTTPDRLDVLAAAAEPEQGNWWSVEFLRLFENEDDEPIIDMVDAEYIAACDPATIRSLVAENKALRGQVTRAAVLLASMRTGAGDMAQELWRAAVAEARALIERPETDEPERAALHPEDGAS